MSTAPLPLDDRATCAELFDFACALHDALSNLIEGNEQDDPRDLLDRFQALRDDITEGETCD